MIRIEQLTTVFGHSAHETLVLDRLDFSVEARAIVVRQLAPTKSAAEVIGTVHQRKRWLSQVPKANSDFAETAAAPLFRGGFGLWSDKSKSVKGIPDGATISLYSDPANGAQGLWGLKPARLITVLSGVAKATQGEIEYHPAAKIPVEKEIYAPRTPNEFAGQLTIGTKYARAANIKKLVAAFTDTAVQKFLATDPSVKSILLPLDAR